MSTYNLSSEDSAMLSKLNQLASKASAGCEISQTELTRLLKYDPVAIKVKGILLKKLERKKYISRQIKVKKGAGKGRTRGSVMQGLSGNTSARSWKKVK